MPALAMNRAQDGAVILSTEAEVRLARMRRVTDDPGTDLPVPDLSDRDRVVQWRGEQNAAWGEDLLDEEAPHQEIVVGGVRCLWAGPAFDADDPTQTAVLYLHGGGFCLGSRWTAAPITARLARPGADGHTLSIVSVDYRLAPEYPFPAALDDAEQVARTLLGGRRLVLAGDSAGASLALGLWQRLEAAGTTGGAIAALIGLSPHLDLRPGGAGGSGSMPAAYLGRADPQDPLVSPAAMSDELLARLPPLLLQSTPADALHPAVAEFTRRAEASGALVEHQVWEGLWHAWQYHRELPEAWDAVDRAAEFARSHLRERRSEPRVRVGEGQA